LNHAVVLLELCGRIPTSHSSQGVWLADPAFSGRFLRRKTTTGTVANVATTAKNVANVDGGLGSPYLFHADSAVVSIDSSHPYPKAWAMIMMAQKALHPWDRHPNNPIREPAPTISAKIMYSISQVEDSELS
jgi:hypothetical protein